VKIRFIVRDAYGTKRLGTKRLEYEINIHVWDKSVANLYIWRKAREEWKPECMNTPPRKKFGIMVWSCTSYNGVGTLAFVKGNLNTPGYQDILEKNLWSVVAKYFPSNDFIFQDDNAPVHGARSTVEYKLRNNIKSFFWPAEFPDINIIENIWLLLKNALKKH